MNNLLVAAVLEQVTKVARVKRVILRPDGTVEIEFEPP